MKSTADGLPIDLDVLDRFRLDSRRLLPSSGLGTFLRRRLGQSKEFREFRDYVMGDDVRSVDWRASLRSGLPGDLIVRTFEAEERLTVAISVDARPSMYLPADPAAGDSQGTEKIRVAGWIARALVEIIAQEGNRVLLHRLFVPVGEAAPALEGGGPDEARDFMATLLDNQPTTEAAWQRPYRLNDASLMDALPPAAVLVVLSDLYFDDDDGRFGHLLVQAQRNYRQVIVAKMDSWPLERAMLLRGTSRINGTEGVRVEDGTLDVDLDYLDTVAQNIQRHMRDLLDGTQSGGLVEGTWSWPDSPDRAAAELRDGFEAAFVDFEGFHSIFASVA